MPEPDPVERIKRNAVRGTPIPAPPVDDDQDLWLISYADVMTLLFAVFVLLVAIVEKSPRREDAVFFARQSAPTAPLELPPVVDPLILSTPRDGAPFLAPRLRMPAPEGLVPEPPDDAARLAAPDEREDALADLRVRPADKLEARYLESLGLARAARIARKNGQVAISIDAAALLDRARPAVGDDGRRILARLYPLLMGTGKILTVEAEGNGAGVASWPDGAARAATIARVLAELGIPAARLRLAVRADAGEAGRIVIGWSERDE